MYLSRRSNANQYDCEAESESSNRAVYTVRIWVFSVTLRNVNVPMLLQQPVTTVDTLPSSLVPRVLCGGGRKRAWYTLFAHAHRITDEEELSLES